MEEKKTIKKTSSVKKTVNKSQSVVKTTKPSIKAKSSLEDSKVQAPATSTSELAIPVYNINGTQEKTVALPKELFEVEASPRLIAQYVRVYLANQRQGNASTKRRSEVTGTTKKVYRQKGTGNAR